MRKYCDFYRKNLADDLKKIPDKEARLQKLAAEKQGPDYRAEMTTKRYDHFYKKQDENLANIAQSQQSIEGIKDAIKKQNINLINKCSGLDQSEHIMKRIDFALQTGKIDLVPENGGLRSKIATIMVSEGVPIRAEWTDDQYRELLKNRYGDLHLSEAELARVVEKIPVDILASVDVDFERAVVLLNALEDTKSRFCCSGHDTKGGLANQEDGFFSHAYVGFSTGNANLAVDVKKLATNGPTARVWVDEWQESGGGKSYTVYFSQMPPLQWIKDNGKRTSMQILSDSRKKLEKILGARIEKKAGERLVYVLMRMQKEYIGQRIENALKPFKINSFLLKEVGDELFETQCREEYESFNKSEEAKKNRDDFIQKLEEILQWHREGGRERRIRQDNLVSNK